VSDQFDSIIEAGDQKGQRRKLIITIILVVIGLHVAGGIVAGLFVVARYFMSPPAQFEVVRDIRLPAQQRQHKMNMAEFDALTPKPSFNDKMASLRPTDFALPDLPQVPMDQMLPLDPSEIVADAVSSLVGAAGVGGGGAGLGGLGGTGEGFSFMGVQASGRRIALLFDVSGSVVNKANASDVPMSRIQEETVKLIDSLGINTRFGLYQFVRNYKPFSPELLPATGPNKEAAHQWMKEEWSETGQMAARGKGVVSRLPNGIPMVLEDVFKQEPDVIFIVSDGSFWSTLPGEGSGRAPQEKIDYRDLRRLIDGWQKNLPKQAVIHFIGYEMRPDEKKELQAIMRANKGTLREIGKD
jgi:hypothetical protein